MELRTYKIEDRFNVSVDDQNRKLDMLQVAIEKLQFFHIPNLDKSDKKFLKPLVFEYLVRPQGINKCYITSITSAFSYFMKDFLDVSELEKIVSPLPNSPGNTKVLQLVEKIAEEKNITIQTEVLFGNKKGWSNEEDGEKSWDIFTKKFRDYNSYFILHIEEHYLPILGYQSEKSTIDSLEESVAWLILSDPSPYHKQSLNKSQHDSISPPIWCLRWGIIGERFRKYSNYGILQLTINN